MNFAKGFKTYAIAIVGVVLGVYAGVQHFLPSLPEIPSFVYAVLGFAGLYTARNGITTDTQKAVTDVLTQITVPAPVPPVTVNVTNASHTDDPKFTSGPEMAGKL